MIYLDLEWLFSPKKYQEKKRIIEKIKKQGKESLSEEEKKIYDLMFRKNLI